MVSLLPDPLLFSRPFAALNQLGRMAAFLKRMHFFPLLTFDLRTSAP
jgi:hypothetical protein